MIAVILAHPWIDAGAIVVFVLLCGVATFLVAMAEYIDIDR
jgi:hypothetical protein